MCLKSWNSYNFQEDHKWIQAFLDLLLIPKDYLCFLLLLFLSYYANILCFYNFVRLGITRIYLTPRGTSLSIGGGIGETKGVHIFSQN